MKTPRAEAKTTPPAVLVYLDPNNPDAGWQLTPAEAHNLGRALIARAFGVFGFGTVDVDVSVNVSDYKPERSAE